MENKKKSLPLLEAITSKFESANVKTLSKGDVVFIIHSDGRILDKAKVQGIVNSYAVVKGEKYWMKATNGKHRKRGDLLTFAMKNEEAIKYAGYDRFVQFSNERKAYNKARAEMLKAEKDRRVAEAEKLIQETPNEDPGNTPAV